METIESIDLEAQANSGVEIAAEINELLQDAERKGYPMVQPSDIRVILVHSGQRILPEISPSLAPFAHGKLVEHGVEVRLEARLASATADQVTLYVIVRGSVQGLREENGRVTPIARLTAGDSFGELGLLPHRRRRSATIRALEPVDVIALGRNDFDLLAGAWKNLSESVEQVARARTGPEE